MEFNDRNCQPGLQERYRLHLARAFPSRTTLFPSEKLETRFVCANRRKGKEWIQGELVWVETPVSLMSTVLS